MTSNTDLQLQRFWNGGERDVREETTEYIEVLNVICFPEEKSRHYISQTFSSEGILLLFDF